MKRIIKYFVFSVFVLVLFSCEQEYTVENTATAGFAGEWYYQLILSDGTVYWDYWYEGPTFNTYNSADNTPNELWFDDNEELGVKALLQISGEPTSFTGTGGINLSVVSEPDSIPVAAGVPLSVLVDDYAYVELLEGKILKNAARVWQDKEQAVADSIYLKFQFSSATFNYTSRQVDRLEEDGSTTTFYVWEKDANYYTVGEVLDTLIWAGHRQTGWEVYLY